ncbi:isoleucine--tRNA ligase [Halolamina sp. CBA1230]|uniref:isoleucine--tRNA ligase n=1 Tax=Halolamina sp. CBA1230 TaxID=1853690 RepID=UPI0009A17C69|nr:isoleucine--tRNA ligase [Halolamina sp. CBA1230]QKY19529.1 isoleucine--tRNA ligase [Halolamina sp. CBA1230]
MDEEVPDQYDPQAVEDTVSAYWDDHDAYERTKEAHADDPPFFFVDGPPYTSGQMHLGTAWNKTLKDAVIRRKRMEGHHVTDRPGYDMHGLPIETKVEQELGFDSKQDIEEYGMEKFIEECKQFAVENRENMDEDFQSIGVWMDWDDPYQTISPEYMESAWWAFSRAHDNDLVEQGKRSITQCPRCETAIAKNEVEYHQVEDPSIYVQFPLSDREGSLVAWTTTPWTVPANTFVAVDKDVEYAKVRAERAGDEDVLYVATDCVDEVMEKGGFDEYEIEETLTGEELIGWQYDHPLAEEVPDHPSFVGAGEVYHADYVETDRTGLVHSAPGHGQEDFERGEELGLDIFCPVGSDGVYDERAGEYAGQFVRDANDDIVDDLRENGYLLAHETYTHDYGQCWRCDTDIIFLATEQWFITVTDVKEDLLENMEDSEWHPPEARENRFRNFIEDSPDWNVSRQRYWGIPIPIWTPEGSSAGETTEEDWIVVGTREELAERADQNVDVDELDLHRPTVDDLTITEDGTTYTRVPDVFDVWLDSSVATWGTLDYPSEDENFDELWPADVIVEAHDQTRGWFWSQLGMGTAAVDQVPYDEVVMHGFALDSDGRKMSKSLGNIVTPHEAIEEVGRDPLRAYLLQHDQHGADLRFEWDGLDETQSTLNILWNVFRFPLPYMELDDYDPGEADLEDGELSVVDEWVLSRLQTVEQETEEAWEEYAVHDALNALLDFVTEDVSRFYVKAIRERMWEESDSASKRGAYATLSTVLNEVVRLLAPFTPYLADRMYQTLDGEADTVHMLEAPTPDEEWHDPELEQNMSVLRDVEEAAANARQQGGRKLRWPVQEVVVETDDDDVAAAMRDLEELFLDRVNAQELTVTDHYEELVEIADPQMSVIGPAFGGDAQDVMAAVRGERREAVEDGVEVNGETVDLTDEMVEYEPKPPEHVSDAEFDQGTVFVDTELTEEIEREGYARDLIRRVQESRKRLELDVEEEIRVGVDTEDERVAGFFEDRRDLVADEVRAAEFVDVSEIDEDRGLVEEWEIEGVAVTIGVEPVDD